MALPLALQNTLALPIVAAPMFLVSNPTLVISCCNSGIIGSLPSLNQRSSDAFELWLNTIRDQLAASAAPFAVNLIVHKTNPRLRDDLAVIVRHRVPIVITSLGLEPEVIDAVHSYGGLVWHDVTTLKFAEKALAAGVDGLIAVCAGAGGHAGTYNPFAFISELRAVTNKTLLAAGAISNGASVLAAIAAGADLAYIGTRFIAAKESAASAEYKKMLIDSRASDICYTDQVSGIPANFMRQSLLAAGIDTVKTGGVKLDADTETKAWSQVWSAGQGVGQIDKISSVSQICDELAREYDVAVRRLYDHQGQFSALSGAGS